MSTDQQPENENTIEGQAVVGEAFFKPQKASTEIGTVESLVKIDVTTAGSRELYFQILLDRGEAHELLDELEQVI
jgi:hypothetical protein